MANFSTRYRGNFFSAHFGSTYTEAIFQLNEKAVFQQMILKYLDIPI